MCLICGHNVQFFNGVPTGRAPTGTIGINTAANFALYVFDGAWQLAGSAFSGAFSSTGGTMTGDVQAVRFFNGPPTGTAPQGAIAFDTSVSPYNMYVFSGGWQQIGSSTAAAMDALAICGPNVLFGAVCDSPPAGVFPRGTLWFPTAGGCVCPMEVYNNGWQCVGTGGGAPPIMKSLIFDTQGLSSITVPFDWNSSNNKIETLASGGAGGSGDNAHHGGGGGGGGGYAFKNNVALTPNTVIGVFVGQEFGTRTTFVQNNAAVVVCSASGGATGADGSAGGAGGAGGGLLVGDGGASGGAGGNGASGAGGAGGGGAGGPLGNGARGGDTGGQFSGASGGGANNGTAGIAGIDPTGGTGQPGGAIGSTGGLGCLFNTAPNITNSGTLGGSGGGPGGATSPGAAPVFQGGGAFVDTSFGPNNGCGAGGCGGAGTVNTAPSAGQNGAAGHNNSGGGGGGGGGASSVPGASGNAGSGGLIKLSWLALESVRVTTDTSTRLTTDGSTRVTA
jgi:hypothetical protein